MRSLLLRNTSSPKARYIPAALVAIGSASLILWTWSVTQHKLCNDAGNALLATPACASLIELLIPLLVAFGFWGLGLALWLSGQSMLVLVFFLLVADVLAVGLVTGAKPTSDEAVPTFYLLVAWLAPVTMHFHHSLLESSATRIVKTTLGVLYTLAAFCSLLLLWEPMSTLRDSGWFVILRAVIRLELLLVFGVAWFLLWRGCRNGPSYLVRQRIRLVTFGTLFAFSPLLLLSLLPETLGAPFFVPYEYTFPWLLLSPLAYGYSLLRHQSVKAEIRLNRAAVYYLLVVMLLSVYLILAAVLNRFEIGNAGSWTLINALLSVVLLILFAPLKQQIQKLTTWVLYGGEVIYAHVVAELAEKLSVTLDRDGLRLLLVDELASELHLSKAIILLREEDGLVVLGSRGLAGVEGKLYQMPGNARLVAFLEATAKPVSRVQIDKTMAQNVMSMGERELLSLDGVAVWLPLVSGGILQGVLLLGFESGTDYVNAEEERILATLCYQGGIATHNVRLLEKVQTREHELSRAHQEVMLAREQEQKRLARELHDGAVQQLLALSHQIYQKDRRNGHDELEDSKNQQPQSLDAIRRGLLGVVTQLRGVIGELRPAGLEEFGLCPALEGYVARLEREGGPGFPKIRLDLGEADHMILPQPIALCLFRSAQEGLRNAVKHAGARHLQLSVYIDDEEAELTVRDDGCGFTVPAHLNELAKANHYGLIGVMEQVAHSGGNLDIYSSLGKGTEVVVRIPLNKANGNDGKPNSSFARR